MSPHLFPSQNKPRISITLHARGKNSLGENRLRLKHSAFHWGILIPPKSISELNSKDGKSSAGEACLQTHTHFDVTDSLYTDEDGVARENWRYRERTSQNPVLDFRILGTVLVGKIPSSSSFTTSSESSYDAALERVRERLSAIPIPVPRGEIGKSGMVENCVSWTKEAIGVLGEMGVRGLRGEEEFELEAFMDGALGFADECLTKGVFGGVLDYKTGRRIDINGEGF